MEKQINFMTKFISYFKVFVVLLLSLWYSIRVLINAVLKGKEQNYHDYHKDWARKVLKVAGVKLTIKGLDNLEQGKSYIYTSNHFSLFDIPVIIAAVPDNVRIIYKEELEKVPFFGWGLRAGPYIAVNRSDPRKSMKSIEAAVESISKGDSVIVFPEGTRSPDGSLQDFKRGAFMLASRAAKPIAPIGIINSNNVLPPKSKQISAGGVEVIFGEPIYEHPATKEAEKELLNRVHAIISEILRKKERLTVKSQ